MAPKKKKPYKTVNEAAWAATDKLKVKGPQDEVRRREYNIAGYGTKLNKAKGDPSQYNEGLGPIPGYKSTATKSKNRFKQGGYLA
jgi:hypothetical protein